MRADYLWHKLEIGLMRVGEPYRGAPRKLLGYPSFFLGREAGKMIDSFLINEVRECLEAHAGNELCHGTL